MRSLRKCDLISLLLVQLQICLVLFSSLTGRLGGANKILHDNIQSFIFSSFLIKKRPFLHWNDRFFIRNILIVKILFTRPNNFSIIWILR